jgi:putative mycofactocin binding protein MftB
MLGSDPPSGFDLDAAWQLHPQAALRPEPFGALLYHFGTRKLSFVKDLTLLAVLEGLSEQPTVRATMDAVGIAESERPRYVAALSGLARSSMLVPRRPR